MFKSLRLLRPTNRPGSVRRLLLDGAHAAGAEDSWLTRSPSANASPRSLRPAVLHGRKPLLRLRRIFETRPHIAGNEGSRS